MVDVEKKRVQLAARALIAHHKKQDRGDLLGIGESVWVQCAFKQTPTLTKQPKRISLAHGLYDELTSDICLITKDTQAEYEELARTKGLPGRVTILSVSKLKSDYKPYEAKRQLCQSFDLFLADDRVIDVLPRLLGKSFFTAKKQPIPIKISAKGGDWAAQLVKARDATYLHIGKGPCSALRVGSTDFSVAKLAENIMLVIEGLVKHDARKGKNIQALHIKTDSSIALPIYNSVVTGEDISYFPGVQGGPRHAGESSAEKDGKSIDAGAKKGGKPERKRKAGAGVDNAATKEVAVEGDEVKRQKKKASAPAAKKSAPAAKKSAPAAKKSAPAAKKSAPAAKKSAPAAKKSAPAAKGSKVKKGARK